MTGRAGIVHMPADSEPMRILLSAADCDDALGVVEMRLAPGSAGPPLHVHPTHGEGFYVLEGELTVQVEDEVFAGGPGTWAFAPRGSRHSLANLGTRHTRVLCVFAPGGFERRFERMLAEGAGAETLPERSAAELATQLIGPPIWAAAEERGDAEPDPA